METILIIAGSVLIVVLMVAIFVVINTKIKTLENEVNWFSTYVPSKEDEQMVIEYVKAMKGIKGRSLSYRP